MYTQSIGTLVYQLQSIKRVLVTLTRQVGVGQVEVCECSQLTELGWDAA